MFDLIPKQPENAIPDVSPRIVDTAPPLLPGICPFILEHRPQFNHLIVVHGQDFDGGAAKGSFSVQEYSLLPKVRVPFVAARIEQRGPRAGERINADKIRLFMEIAMKAPQREV